MVELYEVVDALRALRDPNAVNVLDWMLGTSDRGNPGGLDAVLLLAAAPTTSPAHRSALRTRLVHLVENPDELPEPCRNYLAPYRDRIGRYVELLDRWGPAPWRPELVGTLTAYTGLTRSEATLLLTALPIADWDERIFLSDDQCAVLDLTFRAAEVARMELLTVPVADRIRLLEAAMPDDPTALWARGPDVRRLAETWLARQGRRVPVDEDLLTDLGRQLGFPTGVLRVFTEPGPGDWLHTDGHSHSAGQWITTLSPDGGEPFSDRQLPSAATGLAWLAYHLPAGHPIRANLPRVHQLIRDRLANPGLLIGSVLLADHEAPTNMGLAVVAGRSVGPGQTYHHLRPAYITEPNHPALDLVPDHSPISIRLMRDPAFARMVTALATSTLPAGGHDQNPLLSVPELVDQMAVALHLDHAAASYYLQLLALPDPTDHQVHRWNGWDEVQLAHLGSALLDRGLVVEAPDRDGGRRFFLPGEWLVRRFVPAFEAWKAPLYGMTVDGEPPYRWVLVTRPVAELFRDAAERVLAGDLPA